MDHNGFVQIDLIFQRKLSRRRLPITFVNFVSRASVTTDYVYATFWDNPASILGKKQKKTLFPAGSRQECSYRERHLSASSETGILSFIPW